MDVTIDVSEDGAESIEVLNQHSSDLTICISGFNIEISIEQAEALYRELRPWFEEEPATAGGG